MGLSGLKGDFHEPFSGGWGAVMPSRLPDRSERQLLRHAADRLSVRWYLGVRHVTQGSIPSETERTRRRFFGSRANLASKDNGDNSMLLKQDVAKAL